MSRFYSPDHLWIQTDGNTALIGITKQLCVQLQEIQYLEFPLCGVPIEQGGVICTIESAKMTIDIYSPFDGFLSEVNEALLTQTSCLENSQEGETWLCKIRDFNQNALKSLLTAQQYESYNE